MSSRSMELGAAYTSNEIDVEMQEPDPSPVVIPSARAEYYQASAAYARTLHYLFLVSSRFTPTPMTHGKCTTGKYFANQHHLPYAQQERTRPLLDADRAVIGGCVCRPGTGVRYQNSDNLM